jgi:hypothetical protein
MYSAGSGQHGITLGDPDIGELGEDEFDFVDFGGGRKLQQEGRNAVGQQVWRAHFLVAMADGVRFVPDPRSRAPANRN